MSPGRHVLCATVGTWLWVGAPAARANADDGAGPKPAPDLPSEYDVREADGFRVAFHPAARDRVSALMPQLPAIRDELSRRLGVPVLATVEIRVASMPLELERLAPEGAPAAPDLDGAYPGLNLALVSLTPGESVELEQEIRYRLALLATAEAGAAPRWLSFGFADHFAGRARSDRFFALERRTLAGEDSPALARLSASACFAPGAPLHGRGLAKPPFPDDCAEDRALAADFARFSESQPERLPALFASLRDGTSFGDALAASFGGDSAGAIERAWLRDRARVHGWYPLLGLVGLLGLLGVLARLWLARRRAAAGGAEREPRPTQRRSFRRLRRRAPAKRPLLVRPEHGVPKIEHDGRWHTLH